jgi:hypothetical protein
MCSSFCRVKLAIALAVTVSAFGNASGQDKPAKQPTADVEAAVIREFQDLAGAKQITGQLKSVDLRKLTIEILAEGAKDPQRLQLDRKVSVWASSRSATRTGSRLQSNAHLSLLGCEPGKPWSFTWMKRRARSSAS